MRVPNPQPKPDFRCPVVPPLMGFVRFFPFADVPGARPLPRSKSEDPVRFGSAAPTADRVPSSRFLTASTGCSVLQAAGLLRPAASRRVHCVLRPMVARASSPHRSENPWPWDRSSAPRNAVHTLRRFPLVNSRTASLRPLALLLFPLWHCTPKCSGPDHAHPSHPQAGLRSLCVNTPTEAETPSQSELPRQAVRRLRRSGSAVVPCCATPPLPKQLPDGLVSQPPHLPKQSWSPTRWSR